MENIEIYYLIGAVAFGFLGSKAIDIIKTIASKGESIAIEMSEAFAETADTFKAINEAVKNDDKIDATELKHIIGEGKEALISFKDVIISVKPK